MFINLRKFLFNHSYKISRINLLIFSPKCTQTYFFIYKTTHLRQLPIHSHWTTLFIICVFPGILVYYLLTCICYIIFKFLYKVMFTSLRPLNPQTGTEYELIHLKSAAPKHDGHYRTVLFSWGWYKPVKRLRICLSYRITIFDRFSFNSFFSFFIISIFQNWVDLW